MSVIAQTQTHRQNSANIHINNWILKKMKFMSVVDPQYKIYENLRTMFYF